MKGSSSSHDLYERLGISRDSSKHEIQQAYLHFFYNNDRFHQIALQEHPDKNPNNPEAVQTFQKAVEAYSILTDDLARNMYDVFGDESLNMYTSCPFSTQTSYMSSTATTSSQYFSNSSHFTHTTTYSNNSPSNNSPINDPYLNTNTSSSTTTLPTSNSSSPIKSDMNNNDFSNNNNIFSDNFYPQNSTPSYTQHYSFTNVSFKIPTYQPKTQIINVNCTLNELYSGCTKQLKLSTNSKRVAVVEFEIPKGSTNGTILKTPTSLKDLLDYDPKSIQFVVKEIPHKKYKRINNDLIYEIQLNWLDALLGTNITIPTIDGRIINKHIEFLQSSNYALKIPKCGMPILLLNGKSNEKGDMIVKFNIIFDNLSEDMKNELKKFKNMC